VQEFLFRQPRNADQLRDVIVAMQQDPFAGWACDGDARWTSDLVGEWRRERGRLSDWITAKHRQWSESDGPQEGPAQIDSDSVHTSRCTPATTNAPWPVFVNA
jgi:hypothetical protein